jgi:hypothetical protein
MNQLRVVLERSDQFRVYEFRVKKGMWIGNETDSPIVFTAEAEEWLTANKIRVKSLDLELVPHPEFLRQKAAGELAPDYTGSGLWRQAVVRFYSKNDAAMFRLKYA